MYNVIFGSTLDYKNDVVEVFKQCNNYINWDQLKQDRQDFVKSNIRRNSGSQKDAIATGSVMWQ